MSCIDDAFAPVFRDLTATSPVQLQVIERDHDWSPLQDGIFVGVNGRTSLAGLPIFVAGSDEDRVVEAADKLQEWLVEVLATEGFSTSWPECPDHQNAHPMAPVNDDGVPVWRCPKSGTARFLIGSLG
jgi:hypothetical protein